MMITMKMIAVGKEGIATHEHIHTIPGLANLSMAIDVNIVDLLKSKAAVKIHVSAGGIIGPQEKEGIEDFVYGASKVMICGSLDYAIDGQLLLQTAQIIQSMGIPVDVVGYAPFKPETNDRSDRAKKNIELLKNRTNALTVIPDENDPIFRFPSVYPLNRSFDGPLKIGE